METSVTLTQLPYTGFDYGDIYNSLFWVALAIWSLVVAFIVIKNISFFANMFTGLAKVFMVQTRPQIQSEGVAGAEPESVILQERVVRFDPLVDPIAAKAMRHVAQEPVAQQQAQQAPVEFDEGTVAVVASAIEQELTISREGETSNEYSESDFNTTDFDGVNPDDSWQPSPDLVVRPPDTQNIQVVKPVQEEQFSMQSPPTQAQIKPPIQEQKAVEVFKDNIELDQSGEYPQIILTRIKI